MKILVTGGLGFIGSAVIRRLIGETEHDVMNVDKITYAGDPRTVESVGDSDRYSFTQADICDAKAMAKVFSSFGPDAVLHLAAESHVDRSIDGPSEFIQTNVVGTFTLLEAALEWFSNRDSSIPFRFVHVSTDEVFGSLGPDEAPFNESTSYAPRSPYSASKAASDHLARAWGDTFGLPVSVTNCSNNYGEYQFPEKLIPLMISKALRGDPLPVYGAGENVRDWLYVDDHARALIAVLTEGKANETYAIGGDSERQNIEVVHAICDLLDAKVGLLDSGPRRELVTYVTDRPGHDMRYAVETNFINSELGWTPSVTFEDGLSQTIDWYLANQDWWESILAGTYAGNRLGSVS
jgi:dTDP-glucose 4,6-dehydratase